MKNFFLFTFFILSVFHFTNCKSSQSVKSSEQLVKSLHQQIKFHVKSLNRADQEGLEKVYTEDYEGIFPVSKFESKTELIRQLVENQKNQEIKIEIEILEVSAKSDMAFVVLDWKAIANFGTPTQNELYHKNHLQIWVLNNNNWQLKRSLFYN